MVSTEKSESDELVHLLDDVHAFWRRRQKPDIIFVTGNLTKNGLPDEFQVLSDFLDSLRAEFSLPKTRLFLVPGTSDLDKHDSRILELLRENYTASGYADSILEKAADRELVFKPFSNYRNFFNTYYENVREFNESNYFYTSRFSIGRIQLSILGLNSAWLADVNDGEGKVVLGKNQVETSLRQAGGSDLTFLLMHHPISWLNKIDYFDVAPAINESCDFILHGHAQLNLHVEKLSPTTFSSGRWGEERDDDSGIVYQSVILNLDQQNIISYPRRYSFRQKSFLVDVFSLLNLDEDYQSQRILPKQKRELSSEALENRPAKVFIENIRLVNFRCFERLELQLSEKVNIFVGDNAAGKTALLEACTLALGSFLDKIEGVKVPGPILEQVRIKYLRSSNNVSRETEYPMEVGLSLIWEGKQIALGGEMRRPEEWKTLRKTDSLLLDIVEAAQTESQSGIQVTLPIFIFYGTGRLWRPSRNVSNRSPASRFRAYVDCLEPSSHMIDLFEWLKMQELSALQDKEFDPVYEAVKKTIASCIPDIKSVKFLVRENDLFITSSEDNTYPFRQLSEGVRNMLGVVADIAYRAAILNPHLGFDVVRETPGVVLIDEIDLHLHPKWQQRIVGDLVKTFPKIQFILSTHSPLIVGSFSNQRIISIDKHQSENSAEFISESVQGWRADQILTSSVFNLESSRDLETQQLLNTYADLAVKENLNDHERESLNRIAEQLQLRIPTSGESKQARKAYELIQSSLLEKIQEMSEKEKRELMKKIELNLLRTTMSGREEK